MSTLVVCLPGGAAAAAAECDFVLSDDGSTPRQQGRARLALLPRADERVLLLGAAMLSWQSVQLPRGSLHSGQRARLPALLAGLLEERLLAEPETLHLALAGAAAEPGRHWVVACDKAWLQGWLQAFEAQQLPIQRIVPEAAPTGAPTEARLTLLDLDGSAHCLHCAASGVLCLPFEPGTLAALTLPAAASTPATDPEPALTLLAEPALVATAEAWLQQPVLLQTPAQRWLAGARSTLDLAQFELASSGSARARKRLLQGWLALRQAPQWRPARWGLALLLLVQLLGLNVWAWQQKAALVQQQAAINAMLTETFAGVRVVIDAPLQMQRELSALQRASGTLSARDLEPMLAALAAALPPTAGAGSGRGPSGIDFVSGELRLQGVSLDAATLAALQSRLQTQGLRLQAEGSGWLLQASDKP